MRRAICVLLLLVLAQPSFAGDDDKKAGPDFENIFGFTEGADVGDPGDRSVSIETEAAFGKAAGGYAASESKFAYEFTPNKYVALGFGPLLSAHAIRGVPDFDDRRQLGFGGVSGEVQAMLLPRSAASPFWLSISAEPSWRRLDEDTGARRNGFEIELKLRGNAELVRDTLWLGVNLLYDPGTTHDPDGVGAGWAAEATAGMSGALSYRVGASAFFGAEVWYLRHYEGGWLNNYTGDAVYVGPTLYVRLAPKLSLSAAWNVQVSGRDGEDASARLNLTDFSRQRARLKIGIEF